MKIKFIFQLSPISLAKASKDRDTLLKHGFLWNGMLSELPMFGDLDNSYEEFHGYQHASLPIVIVCKLLDEDDNLEYECTFEEFKRNYEFFKYRRKKNYASEKSST